MEVPAEDTEPRDSQRGAADASEEEDPEPAEDLSSDVAKELLLQQTQHEISQFKSWLVEARSNNDAAAASLYKQCLAKQLEDLRALRE